MANRNWGMAALALVAGAVAGAIAGWAAQQHARREDWRELEEHRARRALMQDANERDAAAHKAWWDSIPAEKKMRMAMRRAEAGLPTFNSDAATGPDNEDAPRKGDDA